MKDELTKNIKFINNKFGDENWVPLQINSLIRDDNIRMYLDCFTLLSPQVKIRVLMSMLHLAEARMEKLEDHFGTLVGLSLNDDDPWVKVTACILRYFPANRQINKQLDFPNARAIIAQMAARLDDTSSKLLPLECRIASKSVTAQICPRAATRVIEKHFQLKRKPKSAALRADLLQRSVEAAAQTRRSSSNQKMTMQRSHSDAKCDDDGPGPFMPIASKRRIGSTSGGGSGGAGGGGVGGGSTVHGNDRGRLTFKGREGGTKMIEISDAPSMKKEKKRKSKKEKEQPENADSDENAVTKRRRESASSQGSVSPKPSAASRRRNSSVSSGPFEEGGQKKRRNSGAYDSSDSASSTSPYRGKKQAAYYPAVASFSGEASYRLNFETQPQQATAAPPPPIAFSIAVPPSATAPTAPQQEQQPAPAPTSAATAAEPNLTLSNDQMVLAQDLFQYPLLSQEDKSTILRFLAANGQLPNPNPALGSVHRYSLNEQLESLVDGRQVKVEEVFELNYETGQYQKCRFQLP